MRHILIVFAALCLASCSHQSQDREEKAPEIKLLKEKRVGRMSLPLQESLPIYKSVKAKLDLEKTVAITGRDGVVVYYTPYLVDGTNRVYASTSTGQEVLYVRKKQINGDGTVGLLKSGEGVMTTYKGGVETITGMTPAQMTTYFAKVYHGGPGFCQRVQGETYQNCYVIEKDEFCDSFWSCIALDTNPQIVILIGLSCSCYATGPATLPEVFFVPIPKKPNYLDSTFKPVR